MEDKRQNERKEEISSVPVSESDELVDTGDSKKDRERKFGEFKPTNAPLSKTECDQRADHWLPRTVKKIGDMQPVPEKSPDES